MKFSEELWLESASIIDAIYQHPFNQELANGTLQIKKFQFYLKQDSLYLIDFARALAITASKFSEVENISKLLQFAQGALIAERNLHQHYFEFYKINIDLPQTPTCFAYTQFLLATTSLGDKSEAIVALLPCFWIYKEVGNVIQKNSVQQNPYQKWIDTYSSKEFSATVNLAISTLDQISEQCGHYQKDLMKEAFKKSCHFEWLFWDSAYHLEHWMP